MNELKEKLAEEYTENIIRDYVLTYPMSATHDGFKAGWDRCLESLRDMQHDRIKGPLEYYKSAMEGMNEDMHENGSARLNLIPADFWDFLCAVSLLSLTNQALKARIEELEKEVNIWRSNSRPG